MGTGEPMELVEEVKTPDTPGTLEPETPEPADTMDAKAVEDAKAARIAAARLETTRNLKALTRLADKIAKMKRSPSPPPGPPLRRKKSNSEKLSELIARRIQNREYGGDELFDSTDSDSNRKRKRKSNKGKDQEQINIEDSLPIGQGSEEPDFGFEPICEGSDVLFQIGTPGVLFGVYSQCLISASPVFEDMLEVNSDGEGPRAISSEYPKVLSFEQENPFLFRIVFRVIHLCNEQVPMSLRPDELLAMSMLSNKYALETTLKFAARQWLLERKDTPKFHGHPIWGTACYMAAAALFGDEEMFERWLVDLVVMCPTPFSKLRLWAPLKSALPVKAVDLLTLLRKRARAKISKILIRETGLPCYSKWDKGRQQLYEQLLLTYRPSQLDRYAVAPAVVHAKRSMMQSLGGVGAPSECMHSIATALDEACSSAKVTLVEYRKILLDKGELGDLDEELAKLKAASFESESSSSSGKDSGSDSDEAGDFLIREIKDTGVSV